MQQPDERHRPSFVEDAGNVSVIALSALFAITVTGLFVNARAFPDHVVLEPSYYEVVIDEATEIEEAVDPLAGADRIFGVVEARSGQEFVGYIRWDDAQASWADQVPARALGNGALAGLRFGHLLRLEPMSRGSARLQLRTGEVVERGVLGGDGASLPRWVSVEGFDGSVDRIAWRDLEGIDFLPEPLESAPLDERLHGTVTTRDGLSFRGYLQWGDEGFLTSDRVRPESVRAAWRFENLEAISREDARSVRLIGADGVYTDLSENAPVDRVVVSDPELGIVEVPWERVRTVEFHSAPSPATYETFDGDHVLVGTVRTEDGATVSGRVRWDMEEARRWEMLDGQHEGLQFHIEFSKVARIQKVWMGSAVELRDGRSFYLVASNDVNNFNRGIEVTQGTGGVVLDWNSFSELTLRDIH